MNDKIKKIIIFVLMFLFIALLVLVLVIAEKNAIKGNSIDKKNKASATIEETTTVNVDDIAHSVDFAYDYSEEKKEDSFKLTYYYTNVESSKTINVDFNNTNTETLYYGFINKENSTSKLDGMGIQEYIFTSNEDVTYELKYVQSTSLTTLPKIFLNRGEDLSNNKYSVKQITDNDSSFRRKYYYLVVKNKNNIEKTYEFDSIKSDISFDFYYEDGKVYSNNIKPDNYQNLMYDNEKEQYYVIPDNTANIVEFTYAGIKIRVDIRLNS